MALTTDTRIRPGDTVKLARIDADFVAPGLDREHAKKEMKRLTKKLRALQNLLYAEGRHSLLVVLQGMDAAGKDGTIRGVFGPINPQGCKVTSFKVPSKLEASHDFLWRCHLAAPTRGQIAVFNRSHYEDVLVVRIHNLVEPTLWRQRYELINDFEKLLAHGGTKVLKFFLHIDRTEQLKRFKKRMDNPEKNWKISDSDYSERRFWDSYTEAFEEALTRCSTDEAPWFVIPSNNKWYRNLAIAQIVADTLEEMKMRYPEPSVDMDEIRALFHKATTE